MGTKISAQTEKVTASSTGAEEIPVNDAGSGKKMKLSTIRSGYMAAGLLPNQLPYFSDANVYLGPMATAGTSVGTLAVGSGRDYLLPIVVPYTRTFTKIAAVVTTLAAGNVRLGLYNADQQTGQPTTNLEDSGDISTGTTGIKSYTISRSLTGGTLYYLAANFSATPTMSSFVPLPMNGILIFTGGQSVGGGLTKARAYAAFIDQSAVAFDVLPWLNTAFPMIGIR